ncbi:hypothetical protein D1610_13470 [Sphingomonas gilva]|uniref:DUF4440 domain-containing protein n=1 Tax=Sphingomonas gilva TaxID=2305907 RepID=A0A396S0K9_9SPHN|nr:hypothetical protein D1610_13470 [Sphingomonas gilva]
MLAALLLAQAAPQSAVDAERAFAADARDDGQWTAFRRWATDDAIMFFPEPDKVQERLRDAPDPPRAVAWQPARSFVSCDGTVAVNTGPWRRPDGSQGYFTTVWKKQADGGWKWVVDHGDGLKTPRADDGGVRERRADCATPAPGLGRAPCPREWRCGHGQSSDDTLSWGWSVRADGSRDFDAMLWNGERYEQVVHDQVAAPKP